MFENTKKNIYTIIYFILFLFISLTSCKEPIQEETPILERGYIIRIPSSYDNSVPTPLVLALHWYAGNGEVFEESTTYTEEAESRGYIIVYPNASGKNKAWNDNMVPDEPDDVKYISGLIDSLIKKYNIDSKKVYITGHSNGAFMSYLLAAKIPDKIAAIAPTSGLLVEGIIPTETVSILHIHGLSDPVIPITGIAENHWLSVDGIFNLWIDNNECSSTPITIYNADGITGQMWEAPSYGDLVLYTISGWNHDWPDISSGLDTAQLIFDFFGTNPKP